MAESIEVIAEREKIAYPFPQPTGDGFGGTRDMTQEEYDQWILNSATNIHNQQLAEEEAAAEALIRQKILESFAKLEANAARIQSEESLNLPQLLPMVEDVTVAVSYIIQDLRNRGIIGSPMGIMSFPQDSGKRN